MTIPLRRGEKGTLLTAEDYDRTLPADSLDELLADTTLFTYPTVAAGDILRTALEGFRYKVAASGAVDHHLTTAGGVKLYVQPDNGGIYNFMAFNPAADGVTDDYAVLVKAINSVVIGSGDGATGPAIFFPDATYYISQTVQIKTGVRLIGNNPGMANRGNSATLKWPVNTTGLRFNRKDTLNGVVVASTTGADASSVEGLALIAASVGTDKTKHGIHTNCRIHIMNSRVAGFSGDGIHIEADSSTAISNPAKYGNANCCMVDLTMSDGNGGHGVYVDGYDANACNFRQLSVVSNGRWGVYESSFLGNTHIGHHAAGNGLANAGANAADQSCYVTFGGFRYAAAYGATEAQLVATTPGTNSAVWQLMKTGGGHSTIPLWVAGKPEGTYFIGGAYKTEGANSRNILLGLYTEGDQGPCSIVSKDFVAGGLVGSAGFSGGGAVDAVNGNNLTAQAFGAWSGGTAVSMGSADAAIEAAFQFSHTADGTSTWRFQRSGGDWLMRNQNLNNRIAYYLTAAATAAAFGTSAPIPYLFGVPTLGIGPGNNARRQTTGTAAPTTGNWARGDVVWNINAAPGGFVGWSCTVAGTPGTWNTFGPISP